MFTLLKRKNQDSHSVFEDLVRRHEASIYRFAYRLTGNHEDAEDLIQEAILEAFSAFHTPGDRVAVVAARQRLVVGPRGEIVDDKLSNSDPLEHCAEG